MELQRRPEGQSKGLLGIMLDLTDTWECMLEPNGDARIKL